MTSSLRVQHEIIDPRVRTEETGRALARHEQCLSPSRNWRWIACPRLLIRDGE